MHGMGNVMSLLQIIIVGNFFSVLSGTSNPSGERERACAGLLAYSPKL